MTRAEELTAALEAAALRFPYTKDNLRGLSDSYREAFIDGWKARASLTPPAAPAESGAPVAWRFRLDNNYAWKTTHNKAIADDRLDCDHEVEPLYTHPPQSIAPAGLLEKLPDANRETAFAEWWTSQWEDKTTIGIPRATPRHGFDAGWDAALRLAAHLRSQAGMVGVEPKTQVRELYDSVAVLIRLRDGERIYYSQDGEVAWLSGGQREYVSDQVVFGLRDAGYLRRVVTEDDDGHDEISDGGRAALAAAPAQEAREK